MGIKHQNGENRKRGLNSDEKYDILWRHDNPLRFPRAYHPSPRHTLSIRGMIGLNRTGMHIRFTKSPALQPGAQLVVLFSCFLLGVAAGCFWAFLGRPHSGLESYLSDYFFLAAQNKLRLPLIATFLECIRWPLAAVLFMFTPFGLVAIPALVLLRGFFLTYSVTCLGILFGNNGLTISLLLFSVTLILELPAFFMLCCEVFRCSQFKKLTSPPENQARFRWELLLMGSGILILATALQLTAIPGLLSAVCTRLFT